MDRFSCLGLGWRGTSWTKPHGDFSKHADLWNFHDCSWCAALVEPVIACLCQPCCKELVMFNCTSLKLRGRAWSTEACAWLMTTRLQIIFPLAQNMFRYAWTICAIGIKSLCTQDQLQLQTHTRRDALSMMKSLSYELHVCQYAGTKIDQFKLRITRILSCHRSALCRSWS